MTAQSRLTAVYRRSPLFVQNLMAAGYGLRERRVRYGGRYREFVRDLKAAEWLSGEELTSLQEARLREMVRFCVTEVPHYRDLFRSLRLGADDIRTPADLAQLPMLSKDEVRADPDRFSPRALGEPKITSATGGTTGTPLRYYVSPSAMQYNYATHEARHRNWAGVRFGERMATILGQVIVPESQRKPPYWRSNRAFNQLYFSAFHMSAATLPIYVDRLVRFRPRFIVAYVSTVHVLAQHLLATGAVGAVRPAAILVSSETLYPWIREEIERAFGCRVFNNYGLGEMTAFMSDCDAGGLHVSPEYGVVEFGESGTGGELITTGLFNRAMPLLRYRTGDLGRPSAEPCQCGRALPLVEELLGRTDDRVVTPEGATVGPAPLSIAFQAVPGIRRSQIVQDRIDAIDVLLEVDDTFTEESIDQLLVALRRRLGPTIRIGIDRVDSIPRTAAGKHRLIRSALAKGS